MRKHKHVATPHYWTPFEEVLVSKAEAAETQRQFNLSDDDLAVMMRGTFWRNNRYQVQVRLLETSASDMPTMAWLSIRRLDRQPVTDWRHLQRIKNELIGPECEGVQLFPAERRLVDTSNQFHMYCFVDPEIAFPFGFQERLVIEQPGGKAKQRSFRTERPRT